LLHNGLRHADYTLVPVIRVPAAPRNTLREVIEITNVADWTTLCIDASAVTADLGALNAGAIVIIVLFYQLSGTSQIPSYDNTILVGGRTLCTGLSNQRDFYMGSTLDVRLPILAPFIEVLLFFPTNQIHSNAIDIGVWVTNDPSYQYGNPSPIGFMSNVSGFPAGAGDSLLGRNNAGYLANPAQGILVPAGTSVVNELAVQTIGKGFFSFTAEAVTGAPLTATEVNSFIVNLSATETGTNIDQLIYAFGNSVRASQGGIPLTAYRQAVVMQNSTAPARDVVFHWTVFTEVE